MGPLISADQRETVSSYVPDGAPVAIRGSAPDGPGYWFPPTVLVPGRRTTTGAAREEIFGPVACVIPFEGEEEAVRLANDTIYGLSGSVWTRDGARALRVARALETGVISINSNTSVRVATPFGGFKQSGVGRELGPDALEHYTEREERLLRDGVTDGAARRKGVRDHGRRRAGSAPRRARLFQRGGRDGWWAWTSARLRGRPGAPGRRDRREQVAGMYARVREEFGRIDVLFNNAGINPPTTCRCSTRRSRPGSGCRT